MERQTTPSNKDKTTTTIEDVSPILIDDFLTITPPVDPLSQSLGSHSVTSRLKHFTDLYRLLPS